MKNLLAIFCLACLACTNETPEMIVNNPNWTKNESIDMNSQFALEEDDEIDLFLSTHTDWQMTETGTGLRYMIYSKSDAKDTARVGNLVWVDFEITLLSGEICYSSAAKGPESFIVEKSDIESGLHEGIKLMCTGDKAKLILPSHLAHGLVGDTEKIPPLTPVIYDITLLKIESK